MELDRIGIRARQRSAWEAIDLGCVLARAWWRPLLLSWMLPSALLFAGLAAALPPRLLWLCSLLVWWLKPLWDNAPLYIASRMLFGETVTPLQAWRRVPGLLRWELLPWLTWRRFSPTRSTDMAVTLLEQLRGEARSHRLSLLHQRIGGGAAWLTIVCANLETLLVLAAVALLSWLVPDTIDFNAFRFATDHRTLVGYLSYTLSFAAMAVVAPFYTMAGFALYISRRIELEAWDIEIRFRHLAAQQRQRRPLAALTLIGALCLLPLHSPDISAAPAASAAGAQAADPAAAHGGIEKILAGPDFHNTLKHTSVRWKNAAQKPEGSVPEWLIRVVEFLEKMHINGSGVRDFFTDTAAVIRFCLAVILVSLFIYALYRYRDGLRRWLRLAPAQPAQRRTLPQQLFGLDVRTSSLPADVLGEVQTLWEQRQARTALSLLYRATLAQLLERFALPFHDDHTEGECVRIAAAAPRADIAAFFADLTRVWQHMAYAHRAPGDAQLQQLCARWGELFDRGA